MRVFDAAGMTDTTAAKPARHQAGERVLVLLVARPVERLEDVLDVLEQPVRDDRRVQTGVPLALPPELAW